MHCSGRAFVRLTPDCGTQSCFPAKKPKAELHNQPSEQNKRCKTELLTRAAAFPTGRREPKPWLVLFHDGRHPQEAWLRACHGQNANPDTPPESGPQWQSTNKSRLRCRL